MSEDLSSTKKVVQAALLERGLYTGEIDGLDGPKTWGAIRTDVCRKLPLVAMSVPQEAIDLILESEGIDQPSQWPGGDSGITIGRGYDLGYEKNFAFDWNEELSSTEILLLKSAVGLTGSNAANISSRFRNIEIGRESADKVFKTVSLPHYTEETLRAFPGADHLPALAFGALVSLVFNRGSGMVGERRTEMRAIRDAVSAYAAGSLATQKAMLVLIGQQISAMKRLWVGKGLDGLLVRRDAEAALVTQAAV